MAVKVECGVSWQCECGKWNSSERIRCWKCHSPKVPPPKKARKRRTNVTPTNS